MSDDTAPAAEPEIRYLGDLQRLELKPGDKLVLTLPGRVSMEMAERIKAEFERLAPGVPLLVLEGGTKLGAVSTLEAGSPIPWDMAAAVRESIKAAGTDAPTKPTV